jgi:hypothetical protein
MCFNRGHRKTPVAVRHFALCYCLLLLPPVGCASTPTLPSIYRSLGALDPWMSLCLQHDSVPHRRHTVAIIS